MLYSEPKLCTISWFVAARPITRFVFCGDNNPERAGVDVVMRGLVVWVVALRSEDVFRCVMFLVLFARIFVDERGVDAWGCVERVVGVVAERTAP